MKFTTEQKAKAEVLYNLCPQGKVPLSTAIVWLVEAVCTILLWIATNED